MPADLRFDARLALGSRRRPALDADREAIVGAVGMQRQTMTVTLTVSVGNPNNLGVLLSSPELFELLGVPPDEQSDVVSRPTR